MKWRELLEMLNKLTPEQREMSVTIYLESTTEFYAIEQNHFSVVSSDITDEREMQKGQPYLYLAD